MGIIFIILAVICIGVLENFKLGNSSPDKPYNGTDTFFEGIGLAVVLFFVLVELVSCSS